MSNFWESQKVWVTGGSGFLGRVVTRKLQERGCQGVFATGTKQGDLTNPAIIQRMLSVFEPTIVIHLAAVVGGIGANRERPAEFFYKNAVMGIHLIHECYLTQVQKMVVVGTICSYPKFTPIPFKEDTLWDGYPEETNAPYGLAKKMLLVQAQAYRQQYGFNAVTLLPTNLYGPGDNFDERSSHVIPALIKKCVEGSGSDHIVVWGDGSPTREFLFVDDAAEGILLAAEKYNGGNPVNLGSGREISIKALVELIAAETGFKGEIQWDTSKPNGQPRRSVDASYAKQAFGFEAKTTFKDGLHQTIDWYRNPKTIPDQAALHSA